MRALVALFLAMVLCACGSSEAAPRAITGPPLPRLGGTLTRFVVEVTVGEDSDHAIAQLAVAPAERGELVATLTIVSVKEDAPTDAAGVTAPIGPLAGLAGVLFRWRMDTTGRIVAAGGAAAPSRVPPATVARALALWPLVVAAVPRLPAEPVNEGARWDAYQRTEVIGGGHELVVALNGEWRLAKILAQAPATVVLEADLTIVTRDPQLPSDEQEKQARTFTARAVVYVNLDRGAVDFATVSSDTFSWQARRL